MGLANISATDRIELFKTKIMQAAMRLRSNLNWVYAKVEIEAVQEL